MADSLDFEKALMLARQLKAIPNFPWDDDVIKAHAGHLVRWCSGTIIDGRVWPAEAQANWLVTEVQEKWSEKWLGPGALKQIFDTKFCTVKPANGFQDLGKKPPIECASCADTGIVRHRGKHRYCDCRLGERMNTDSGENGSRWLARMDKSFIASFRPEPVRRPMPDLQELEAEYFANQEKPPEDSNG